MICAQLNINSVRNKFDIVTIVNIANSNIDILIMSEAKLGPSFPTVWFHIHDFSEPHRFDKNGNGGGIFSCTLFFNKNNFIRTRASYLTKSYEQAKNNLRLTFSENQEHQPNRSPLFLKSTQNKS